jgi:hypothetical protein
MRTFSTVQREDCAVCKGNTSTQKKLTLTMCSANKKLHARPTSSMKISLENLDNAFENYRTAVRVRIGTGSALVHSHGLVEFNNVSREDAITFVLELYDLQEDELFCDA